MITIIDYGMGNLGSISNMLKKLGFPSVMTNNPDDVAAADKLILPGIGAFDRAVTNLHNMGLYEVINHKVLQEKTLTLGICLGMQLLTDGSEEGQKPGFGWIKGYVRRFKTENTSLKVPHMGWNEVRQNGQCAILDNVPDEKRFYFVHSFHVCCENAQEEVGITKYGYDFASVICKENVYGTQFHPEKSHKYGMALLKTFAELPV
jgi:imidazole glycerol-phosphate synthase subunit HisH